MVYLGFFTHLCKLCGCFLCMYVCAHAHVCMNIWRPEVDNSLSILFFEMMSLAILGVYWFSETGWPSSFIDMPVSVPTSLAPVPALGDISVCTWLLCGWVLGSEHRFACFHCKHFTESPRPPQKAFQILLHGPVPWLKSCSHIVC